MNSKTIKALKIILPLILGVFLIWFSLSSINQEQKETLLLYITQANPYWITLSIILGLISHLSRAYRWNYLLKPLGYKIKIHNGFMAIMAGYFANLGIPRSGEILRGGLIATYENIPFKKAFGTIISERVIDLIMLFLVVLLTIILQANNFFKAIGDNLKSPLALFIILILSILIGIIGLRILKKSNHPFIIKIRDFGEGILEGIKSIFNLQQKVAFIFHSVFIWVLYIAMFFVIKYTVPETSALGIGPLLVMFVAGSLAMSFTNAGLGAFPLAIAYTLMIYGIEEAAGLAFGWILWGSQTAINIIAGSLSFFLLPLVNKQKDVPN